MALNQTAYTVNPSRSITVGTEQSVGTNDTTTIYTVGSGEAKKVTSFTLTMVVVGTAGTDYTGIIITIGTAKFNMFFDGAIAPGAKTTVTSASLGYAPSFLQVGDIITVENLKTGTPTGNLAICVTLDEYMA